MDPTRRGQPLPVFQHPHAAYASYNFGPISQQQHLHPTHNLSQPHLQPAYSLNVPAMASQHDSFMNPHMRHNQQISPYKREAQIYSPHLEIPPNAIFESVYFPQPGSASFANGSPLKRLAYSAQQYQQPTTQRPQKALFATFPTARSEKENSYPQSIHSDDQNYRSESVPLTRSALGKHQRMDQVSLREKSVKKQRLEDEEEEPELPEPEDMPILEDEGVKPNCSYAHLIGMAILRAPNRRLTLAQIYKWISDTYSYYRDAEPGWMNSIRHNLSLNKAFERMERPKDEPGKGNHWFIVKGMEKQFLKTKNTRRPTTSDGMTYLQPLSSDGSINVTSSLGTFALPPRTTRNVDSTKFGVENETISSDATVPEEDGVQQDEEQEPDESLMPPPPLHFLQSSLQSSPASPNIQSSPPIIGPHAVSATPPSVPKFNAQQNAKHRRDPSDSFKDSGFYSSIESSAPRASHTSASLLTSEADLDRALNKRGRAEEEIARIRGSSFDPSPTKSRPAIRNGSAMMPSSPLRQVENVGLTPITPGLKLRAAIKAPPSTASPNTYLRRHRETVRELVGTPCQKIPTLGQGWSPAFKTPAFVIHNDDDPSPSPLIKTPSAYSGAFGDASTASIFGDYEAYFARGSPVKPSIKRPLLHRANSMTTPGVLRDVTGGSKQNTRLASPIRMLAPKQSMAAFESPMKKTPAEPDSTPKRLGWTEEDMWAINLESDEEADESANEKGIDITKGFRKIGDEAACEKENQVQVSQKPSKSQRPPIVRSVTNVF